MRTQLILPGRTTLRCLLPLAGCLLACTLPASKFINEDPGSESGGADEREVEGSSGATGSSATSEASTTDSATVTGGETGQGDATSEGDSVEETGEATGGGCRPGSCDAGEFCKFATGSCGEVGEGVCVPEPEGCDDVYEPVCGCDGQTYANRCDAQLKRVNLRAEGACPGDDCGLLTEADCRAQTGCMAVYATPLIANGDHMCLVAEDEQYFECIEDQGCGDAETTWIDEDSEAYWWTSDTCGPTSLTEVIVELEIKRCDPVPCGAIPLDECAETEGCGHLTAVQFDRDEVCKHSTTDFGCVPVLGDCGDAAIGFYEDADGQTWMAGLCHLESWTAFSESDADWAAVEGPSCAPAEH